MSRRHKIAMIGHKRIPGREGGVEVVVEELSVRMAKLGIEVEAYNRRDKWFEPQQREYCGVRIIQIPTFKTSALNAFVYSVLATLRALFGRYGCIHYHAEGPCAMLWLPKLFGIRIVATIHGLDWQRAKWGGFSTKYLKLGERVAARFADELIVLSENNRLYFKQNYGREAKFIPNGICMKERDFLPQIIKERFVLERDGYILFLARLVPEKGLHYLIEAYKKIDTSKKLVIAGSLSGGGDYVNEIKASAAGDERIIFTDFVSGGLMDELFDNCLVYVLPSDIEGMAMTLLEALSYGKLCLVSDIPENLEVVQGKMPSFRHGDAESLRQELIKVLSGDYDSCRGRERCREILKPFNWDEIVKRTVSLYNLDD